MCDTAQKNIGISIDASAMRRTCMPGRGAFTNAAVPARQMNGTSSSSVAALRSNRNSPTGYFATSHLPTALVAPNRNTATSM
jgi:hypothetical protein